MSSGMKSDISTDVSEVIYRMLFDLPNDDLRESVDLGKAYMQLVHARYNIQKYEREKRKK